MKDLAKMIAAGVSTVALAGGIGAGLAYADAPSDGATATPTVAATSTPEETPAAKPTDKRDQNDLRKRFVRRHLRFVARALHGEVTLSGEEHRVIAFQRGQVHKVNSKSVTVKSEDGFVGTYTVSDATKVRKNGNQAKVSDIGTSDRVLIVATKDGSTLNARRVIVRDN